MPWVLDDEELKPPRGRWVLDDAPPTFGDRAQAGAAGFNSGVLTGLLGLPVDTAANVIDLAKAGYGAVKGAMGGTDLPEISPRADVPGSSAWIAKQMRDAGAGQVIDPNRPDDLASRVIHAGGSGLGASLAGARIPAGHNARTVGDLVANAIRGVPPGQSFNATAAAGAAPNLLKQGAMDAGMASASGAAAQSAMEATDNPAMAILAGMTPQAAVMAPAAATRGLVRGGEASRKVMEDRLATLKAAGVETPSVGLATGNRRTAGNEAFLTRVPGAAGVLQKNAAAVNEQIGAQAAKLAEQSAPHRGPETAGATVRAGIDAYRTRQQDIEAAFMDRLKAIIPPDVRFPASGMMQAGDAVTQPVPGAPAITGVRDSQRGFVNRMNNAVTDDAAPVPPQQVPSQILGPNGQPLTTTVPGRPGGLPFDALKQTKSLIGENAYPAANQLLTDQSTGAAKKLYGGAKQDIATAASLTDLIRVANGQPPRATKALERADKFYAKTQKILEDVLQPIYKGSEGASEKAFYAIERGAQNTGSLTRQTMMSLPADVRAQVSATVIDRLGRAKPGQQNEAGTAFSPETFLTNWDKITPEAKGALFMGYKGASTVRQGLDSIAKAANMLRQKGKIFPNPSGTTQTMTQLGMASGMGASLLSGDPWLMATAFGAPVMAHAGAKLMTSPTFVNWLAKSTTVPESRAQQHIYRLAINANGEKDKEARAAMLQLAQELGLKTE